MTKHMETDDEFFIRQERQREERATWGRDRQPSSGGGRDGADVGRGSGRREANSKRRIEEGGSKEEVARERMDNIRVYSLIFLLKVRLGRRNRRLLVCERRHSLWRGHGHARKVLLLALQTLQRGLKRARPGRGELSLMTRETRLLYFDLTREPLVA